MTGEELVSGNLPLVGVHDGAEPQYGSGIVGRGIVVGDRAAERAAIAHLRIADRFGEFGERRNGLAHERRRATSA